MVGSIHDWLNQTVRSRDISTPNPVRSFNDPFSSPPAHRSDFNRELHKLTLYNQVSAKLFPNFLSPIVLCRIYKDGFCSNKVCSRTWRREYWIKGLITFQVLEQIIKPVDKKLRCPLARWVLFSQNMYFKSSKGAVAVQVADEIEPKLLLIIRSKHPF